MDKVINEMEEGIEDNTDHETGEHCDNWVVDMCNDLIGHCILIVQAGYIEKETKTDEQKYVDGKRV